MGIVKTTKEFQKMKNDITKKLSSFIKSYNTFSRSISPHNWRTSGHFYTEFIKLRNDIKNFKPITNKDLENDFIRDQVLTPKERELYNNMNKYNL